MNPSPHAAPTIEVGVRRWSADLPTGVKEVVPMMGAALSRFCRLNRSNPYRRSADTAVAWVARVRTLGFRRPRYLHVRCSPHTEDRIISKISKQRQLILKAAALGQRFRPPNAGNAGAYGFKEL
jgi:hypothetical protein